ncbi:phosphatidate cytidylyltransferase [Tessaracoccus antarcticus]|uniref:Phosphatidate cytidylyltransferase n=1 Tax=Tessaracoccus antarcticus TaxID=2479848 RepID=A0A3M0GF30_9ACTN|nr:phosphatidate cytidylyltransferase [Tessaracoccus antarcticus]RMB59769.1 phosphatidate cytidylyltransferase [Tessaracoccus antarcticus]
MTTAASTPLSNPPTGRNLPAAIAVGVAAFAAVAGGLLFLPWLFVAVIGLGLCLAVVELDRALQRKGIHASRLPILVGTGLSFVGGYAVSLFQFGLSPVAFVMVCAAGTMLAALVARLSRGPEGFMRDAAGSGFIVAYIPLMGVFVPLLLGAENGSMRLVAIISCVVVSDVSAYAVGSQLGRHKLAPLISPSKTWEGLAGSIVFAGVAGVLLGVFLLDTTWWVGLIMGVALSLGGTLGDLVESLIKRDAGIKDMSNFLPGHGGVMDRLDSMLVAVPVGWLVLHLALGA